MMISCAIVSTVSCIFVFATGIGNQAGQTQINSNSFSLESIHGTSGQQGLKKLSTEFKILADGQREFKHPYGSALEHIVENYHSGVSDVTLVSAIDITNAIKMTGAIYARGYAADVKHESDPRKRKYCLVVYLGAGAKAPLTWNLKSVEIEGKKIRVKYERNNAKAEASIPYFYWALVGELKKGNYMLEIVEAGEKSAGVIRQIDIP